MKNTISNKSYTALFALLLLSSFAVNFCNQIYQCACFFTVIMSTSWLMSNKYGQKTAITSLFVALLISGSLTLNINYTIHGKVYNGIVLASLLSTFVSYVAASLMFNKSSKILPVLIAAALIDGAMMSGYFMNKISLENVGVVLAQELFFKAVYSALALMAVNLIASKTVATASIKN